MPKPLFHKKLLLEKYPGKGGWTYAQVPGISANVKRAFGMVKIKGSIDNYQLKKYHLMPMRNGNLFLPVNAEARKAINKKAGDHVEVILYIDDDPVEIPVDLQACLEDEPKAFSFFNKLSDTDKQNYIDWIYKAKKEETRVDRMAKTIERLANNMRFYDKP
jgi:hypothetical protein